MNQIDIDNILWNSIVIKKEVEIILIPIYAISSYILFVYIETNQFLFPYVFSGLNYFKYIE